ncbi:MAG: MMPL family transporter, partial [Bacteroidetes bacterium]|nr:MMPL family transporter [Bacteroidota bacterium]
MLHTIARIILRNRILILIIIAVITAFMAYHATHVKLTYEYAKLLPDTDTASIIYDGFKEIFGEETNKIILGIHDPDFYSLQHFNAWYDLGEELSNMEGVENVLSATHCYNLVKNPEIKKFALDTVVDKKPETQKEVDSLAGIIRALPFYRGILYNDTSDVQVLIVSLSSKKFNSPERLPLIDNIVEAKEAFEAKYNMEVHISGLPFIRTAITYKLKTEMYMFVILAFILMIIILAVFFKSPKSVLVSMLIVAIGVIWTFGSIELFDYKITILTSLIPPLVIVIGIPNSIFLINKYHNEYKAHGDKIKALQTVISKIGSAIFLTNLTTAAGFATFIITDSKIMTEF